MIISRLLFLETMHAGVGSDLGNLRSEALFAIPGTGNIVLLSDDGGIVVDGRECRKRKRSQQTFRAMTLSP